MTTVQDLINLHRKAQEYDYRYIRVLKEDGTSEQYTNVTKLTVDGAKISFVSTVDIRDMCPLTTPSVYEVWVRGHIISTSKRIL